MSTHLHDVAGNVLAKTGLSPQTLSTGANSGSALDLLHGEGQCFAIQLTGAVAGSGTVDGKIQESEASGSGYADISGATFTALTSSNAVEVIRFVRTKRYVRYVGTIAGTSVVTACFIGEQKKTV